MDHRLFSNFLPANFYLMKLNHTLLLALAAATLASCSAEPSDWRPDQKVSLDMVEPGTRASENYDQTTPSDAVENKGAPGVKAAKAEAAEHVPSAESAITANAEEGMRKRGKLNDAGKSGQADTAANGHQMQR